MEFERALQRIRELAQQHGGLVTAAQVEADPELSADRNIVSAAGHLLAGSTNVFSVGETDAARGEWFPYPALVFSETPPMCATPPARTRVFGRAPVSSTW